MNRQGILKSTIMKRITKKQAEKMIDMLSAEIKSNYPHLYNSIGGRYVQHYLRTRTRIPRGAQSLFG